MVVKYAKEGSSQSSVVLKKLAGDFGAFSARKASETETVSRIPFGVLGLDVATGGGIPRGRVTILWGSESSGKTLLSYLLMAAVQREGRVAVYVDMEHTLDPVWAAAVGLDLDALIVIEPAYAEQAIDMLEALLQADDVGIVVLDSIAALMSENEGVSSAEKAAVGGASYLVGKLIRKVGAVLGLAAHKPAVVLINQQRTKIGQMFGDPTTMPGGNSLRFASSLTLRLYGKKIVDKEVHPTAPARLEVSGTITKSKVLVSNPSFEYKLSLLPVDGVRPGTSDDWPYAASMCKSLGLMYQDTTGKKEWHLLGKVGRIQGDIAHFYATDDDFRASVNGEIVKSVMPSLAISDSVVSETATAPVANIPGVGAVDTTTGEVVS